MRIALTLSGTDQGRSGLSVWIRGVLPPLRALASEQGHSLLAFGTQRDGDAYAEALEGITFERLPSWVDEPAAGAAWHLARFGPLAARRRADVVLLPSAQRRAVLAGALPVVAVVHDLGAVSVPGKYDRLRTFYVTHLLTAAARPGAGCISTWRCRPSTPLRTAPWRCSAPTASALPATWCWPA